MDRATPSGWAQMRSFIQPTFERLLDERIRDRAARSV
jgi:hypothetical protein